MLLLLALLASTTIYGAIIAFSIGLGLLLELFDVDGKRLSIRNKRLFVIGLVAFSLSAFAFAANMRPPETAYKGDWQDYAFKFFKDSDSTVWRLDKSAASILTAYLPIPDPRSIQNFWGSTIFIDRPKYREVWLFLSVFIFLSVAGLFKDRLSRTAYTLGTLGIAGFTFLFFIGSVRHYGQLFVLLIACLWIALDRLRLNTPADRASGHPFSLDSKFVAVTFTSVLFVHYLVGMFAVFKDYRGIFSPGRQVAEYIRENKLDSKQIVVMPDYCGTNLSAHLEKKVYSLWHDQEITFEPLNISQKFSWAPVAARACALADKWNRPILLVTEKRLSQGDLHARIELLRSFDDCIVPYDSQHLYLIKPNPNRLK